ncbi:MAG: GNAT family N-acetyltransferase [Maioricimonas sp. JB049]
MLTSSNLVGTPGTARRQHRSVVRLLPLDALTTHDMRRWQRLAHDAASANPFSEPDFVIPLVDAGLVRRECNVVVVEDVATSRWIAATVVHALPSSAKRPLPRLTAIDSPYTFLDQPLVDAHVTQHALRTMLDSFSGQRQWHGLRFRRQAVDSPLFSLLRQQPTESGVHQICDHTWSRAAVCLNDVSRDQLLSNCSRSRRKSLRRNRDAAGRQGGMSFRLLWPASDDLHPLERFLRLENMGWKKSAGTALASRPKHQQFFRDMVRRFAQRRAVCFGELMIGDDVIASSCNLVGGDTLFAFKIGWNPDFSRFSPGYWAEIELAHAVAQSAPALRIIDSCSPPGSYTESVWPDRRAMAASMLVWSRRARMLVAAREYVRMAREPETLLAR